MKREDIMILSCNNISKAFGTDSILEHVSFHIEEREKAAIVGINGAGKTTLFKIIAGQMGADEGDVVISRGKTLGYLAQHQDISSDNTIYDELMEVKKTDSHDGAADPRTGNPDEASKRRRPWRPFTRLTAG